MNKISIIGAGNVGATTAMKLAEMNIVDEIVLLDIKEGLAEGKAIDIMQCADTQSFKTSIVGVTNDYSATKNSNVIVITSGVPRKPGMTREQLVGINASIMQNIVKECDKQSPNAIYVVVSNPMDTMTYYVLKILEHLHKDEIPRVDSLSYDKRVIGMGGMLDSSRFKYFICKALNEKGIFPVISNIDAMVIGGHGDSTMIPLFDDAMCFVNYSIIHLNTFFTEEEKNEIIKSTMKGGATITNLIGTSAWEAPAANIAHLVESIIYGDTCYKYPCSVYLSEYDLCIGVPIILHKYGPFVIDIPRSHQDEFKASIDAIRSVNAELPEIK